MHYRMPEWVDNIFFIIILQIIIAVYAAPGTYKQ